MNSKIKIFSCFVIFFFIVTILFSVFYQIQTFFVSSLIEYSGSQILQIKKTKETNFYKSKKIYVKDETATYLTYIQSVSEDANYYYLTISKYFYDYQNIEKIWIYNKKVSLCEYVIKSFFDF